MRAHHSLASFESDATIRGMNTLPSQTQLRTWLLELQHINKSTEMRNLEALETFLTSVSTPSTTAARCNRRAVAPQGQSSAERGGAGAGEGVVWRGSRDGWSSAISSRFFVTLPPTVSFFLPFLECCCGIEVVFEGGDSRDGRECWRICSIVPCDCRNAKENPL